MLQRKGALGTYLYARNIENMYLTILYFVIVLGVFTQSYPPAPLAFVTHHITTKHDDRPLRLARAAAPCARCRLLHCPPGVRLVGVFVATRRARAEDAVPLERLWVRGMIQATSRRCTHVVYI